MTTVNVSAVLIEGTTVDNARLRVEMLSGGHVVATAEGDAQAVLTMTLTSPKLWSPDSPFL
jgi:beta-galactosidase/beta-glucuronidase